jgi:hypothetical protein
VPVIGDSEDGLLLLKAQYETMQGSPENWLKGLQRARNADDALATTAQIQVANGGMLLVQWINVVSESLNYRV